MLDAYPVLALLRDEPARAEVESLLRLRTDQLIISALNLGEVSDVLGRSGIDADSAERMIDLIRQAGVYIWPVTDDVAVRAGLVRAAHYHPKQVNVSLADCVALVTAEHAGHSLATSDPALASVARIEGVRVHALPDTQGRRPLP